MKLLSYLEKLPTPLKKKFYKKMEDFLSRSGSLRIKYFNMTFKITQSNTKTIKELFQPEESRTVLQFLQNIFSALKTTAEQLGNGTSNQDLQRDIKEVRALFLPTAESSLPCNDDDSRVEAFKNHIAAYPPQQKTKLIDYLRALPTQLWKAMPERLISALKRNQIQEMTPEELAKVLQFNKGGYQIWKLGEEDWNRSVGFSFVQSQILTELVKGAVDNEGHASLKLQFVK